MYIDTLEASKHLQDVGFNDSQAEAILRVFNTVQDEIATKADINRLEAATKADIKQLEAATKADIKQLEATTKAEIKQLEATTKAEIKQLESTTITEIKQLRTETEAEIKQLRTDNSWLKWMAGVQIAALIAATTIVVSVVTGQS